MSDNNGCPHNDVTVGWDYSTCRKCGSVRTDSQWGIASLKWFESLEDARFYQENGRIPERHGDSANPLDAHAGAAELAFRDAEIYRLRNQVNTLTDALCGITADYVARFDNPAMHEIVIRARAAIAAALDANENTGIVPPEGSARMTS